MFLPKILIFPFLFLIFTACNNEDEPTALLEETIYEVSYGADPLQKLDVYLPASRTLETKLLIFVHGGNWNAGDKSDYALVLSDLQHRGFAIANINYRLANSASGILYTELADDVRAAVDFLISKSNGFVYSPTKILIAGHTAGGHLALYTAYPNNADTAIKAVFSLAGPTDLTNEYFLINPELNGLVENLTGTTYLEDTATWIEASPVTHVTASSVPTLLKYCGFDFTVPSSQGEILNNVLNIAEVEHQYYFYPLYGHDMGTIYFGGHLPEDVKNDILNFVETYGN